MPSEVNSHETLSEHIEMTGVELQESFKAYTSLLTGSAQDIERHHSRLEEDLQNIDEAGTPPPYYQKNIENLLAAIEEYTSHLDALVRIHDKLSTFFLDDQTAAELKKIIDDGYARANELAKLVIQLPKEKDRLTFAENLERAHEKMAVLLHDKLEDVKRRSKLIDQSGNRLATPEDVEQTSWEGENHEAAFKLSLIKPELDKALEETGFEPTRLATDTDFLTSDTFLQHIKRLTEQKHDLELSIKTANIELAKIPEKRSLRSFLENLYPEKKLADAQVSQAKLKRNPATIEAAFKNLQTIYQKIETNLTQEQTEAEQLFADELNQDALIQEARNKGKAGQRLLREGQLKKESIVYKNIDRLKRMKDLLHSDSEGFQFAEIDLTFDANIPIKAQVSGSAEEVVLGDNLAGKDEALEQLMKTDPKAAASASLNWTRRSDSGEHPIQFVDVSSPDIQEAVLRNNTDNAPQPITADTTPPKPFDTRDYKKPDKKNRESLN